MLSLFHLPNKQPHEQVIKVIRKDVFILLKKIVFLVLLVILPLLFFYFFILKNPDLAGWSGTYPLLILGFSAYYLFLWLFFFFSFIDYYLDAWIITSDRIIDIQQDGFFSRTISEHKLFRIQDVTSEVKGFFPTILKYGDIFVQTAGAKQRFHFDDVPNPDATRDLIIKLVEKKRKETIQDEKSEA